VPSTDLTKRGADDRALAVYFIFGTGAGATKGPIALLRSPSIRALVYVFGGNKPRGELVPSPHMGSRGAFIVLRPATASKGVWFEEEVDVVNDYSRGFGQPPPRLLAVAISSDSDNTRTRNRARINTLSLE
jgi:hypothetical protein